MLEQEIIEILSNLDKPAKSSIEIKKNNETLIKIINSMISNLRQLESAYPNNIEIKEENNE